MQYIVLYNTLQCNVEYNTIQYNTIHYEAMYTTKHCNAMYNALQCNAMYNTLQCNVKYNTIQYNTIQYNTIQYNNNTIQCNVQYNTIHYNVQCNTLPGKCSYTAHARVCVRVWARIWLVIGLSMDWFYANLLGTYNNIGRNFQALHIYYFQATRAVCRHAQTRTWISFRLSLYVLSSK
jgi:hypothetical protein